MILAAGCILIPGEIGAKSRRAATVEVTPSPESRLRGGKTASTFHLQARPARFPS